MSHPRATSNKWTRVGSEPPKTRWSEPHVPNKSIRATLHVAGRTMATAVALPDDVPTSLCPTIPLRSTRSTRSTGVLLEHHLLCWPHPYTTVCSVTLRKEYLVLLLYSRKDVCHVCHNSTHLFMSPFGLQTTSFPEQTEGSVPSPLASVSAKSHWAHLTRAKT